MEKSILMLGENDAIHCPTLEDAIELCSLMDKLGLKWGTGMSFVSDNNWAEYKEKTTYIPKVGKYCSLIFAKKENYNIYNVKDFLKKQIKEEEKGMKKIYQILNKLHKHPELRRKIVPLFISNPGMGKTSIIYKFAEDKGVRVEELITSTETPYEATGITVPDREIKQMVRYISDKLCRLRDGDILFLDEILNGNPATLNALLTMIETRKLINGESLPDIIIVAAANPQGAAPLTPQIKERFVWYPLTFDAEYWKSYMSNKYKGIPKKALDFCVNKIQTEKFIGDNFYTPRSVDKAVTSIIYDMETPYEKEIKPLLESDFIRNYTNEPILCGEKGVILPNEQVVWLKAMQMEYNVFVETETENTSKNTSVEEDSENPF